MGDDAVFSLRFVTNAAADRAMRPLDVVSDRDRQSHESFEHQVTLVGRNRSRNC